MQSYFELMYDTDLLLAPIFAVDMDADIFKVVQPTFSRIFQNVFKPMLELQWDQEYCRIATRIKAPGIHFCELCRHPISIYGRMVRMKY